MKLGTNTNAALNSSFSLCILSYDCKKKCNADVAEDDVSAAMSRAYALRRFTISHGRLTAGSCLRG